MQTWFESRQRCGQRPEQVLMFLGEDSIKSESKFLKEELTKIQAQIANLATAPEEKPDDGPGKGDPGITRWDLSHALLGQLRGRRESVKRALSRSDQGTYGICTRCDRDPSLSPGGAAGHQAVRSLCAGRCTCARWMTAKTFDIS